VALTIRADQSVPATLGEGMNRMNIRIEAVVDAVAEAAACCVREEVFGREWHLTLPPLPSYDAGQILTLIARKSETNEAIAALSVVDTTGNKGLYWRFGLSFYEGARVARYTQLAVLKPYRGMHIPARLILEARRRFVAPRGCAYSWLLFNADHAKGSSLCTLLGFKAGTQTVQTEYGRSRVLDRDEAAPTAEAWDRKAMDYLNGVPHFNSAVPPAAYPPAAYPQWVRPAQLSENEWLAH
jgi:GNAT superfamily N-acetyltransferase